MLVGNFNDTGGRQVHQDDLRLLQQELYKAIQLQYVGQGAFIVQGCLVTGTVGNYSISDGLVFVDSLLMQFSAVSGITSFPKYIAQAAPVNQDSFPLEQGGTAYKRTLVKAELVNSVPVSGEFITMSAGGGRNYNDILSAQFVRLSGNQTVNGQKTFTSDVISNGVNVNSEFSNVNLSLANKANKTITVTGAGSLAGGGDLTANRTITLSDGGVGTVKLADGSVSSVKLGTDLVKVKSPTLTLPTINSGAGNVPISATDLPGCKFGFWAVIQWGNNYPAVGVLSYRLTGVGIDGQNVMRETQAHYHTGSSGGALSVSGSYETTWFCPLPPGITGSFSMGHYVGSGASCTVKVLAYL